MSTLSMHCISVVIPVFNWDASQLLDELQNEVVENDLASRIQILVFDDGSDEAFREKLKGWWRSRHNGKIDATLISSGANVGRSEARNQLIEACSASHILFLDADVLPDSKDFLRRYLAAVNDGVEIVVGGLSYARIARVETAELFYLNYSSATSCEPATVRQRYAWRYLFTANVLVSQSLVQSCPLSIRFKGYGYEDVEWALRLSERAQIVHIENTVTHCGLLTKHVLWRKQREAAVNGATFSMLRPDIAGRMSIFRAASLLRYLPDWFLSGGASVAGNIYLGVEAYRVAYVALQVDKVLSTALAIKRAVRANSL
jgi:glycosyltransferase involved in cell wall biosynthesis